MDDRLRQTRVVYRDTPPGPRALKKKFNEAIWGLLVYGKGANKNKLVIHRLFWTRPQFKPCYSNGWVSSCLDNLPHKTLEENGTVRVMTEERKVELDHFLIQLSKPMDFVVVETRHETL